MADYTPEINDALEFIEEFGGDFTVERLMEAAPVDPSFPWRKDATAALSFNITGVMLEYKRSQQSQGFTAGSEDARAILPGDMIVYLAAGDPAITFEPAARDIVIPPIGGRWGVVDNITLAPNGQAILYKLWIRK